MIRHFFYSWLSLLYLCLDIGNNFAGSLMGFINALGNTMGFIAPKVTGNNNKPENLIFLREKEGEKNDFILIYIPLFLPMFQFFSLILKAKFGWKVFLEEVFFIHCTISMSLVLPVIVTYNLISKSTWIPKGKLFKTCFGIVHFKIF